MLGKNSTSRVGTGLNLTFSTFLSTPKLFRLQGLFSNISFSYNISPLSVTPSRYNYLCDSSRGFGLLFCYSVVVERGDRLSCKGFSHSAIVKLLL